MKSIPTMVVVNKLLWRNPNNNRRNISKTTDLSGDINNKFKKSLFTQDIIPIGNGKLTMRAFIKYRKSIFYVWRNTGIFFD